MAPDKFTSKFETSQSNGYRSCSTQALPHTACTFTTKREFNKKFPTKIFICTKCAHQTINPYYCTRCKNQSNNFIYQGYTYTILETGITETIFIPIELLKDEEKQNDKTKTQ